MNIWDQRYDADEFVYGTEPNDFLASVADQLPRGRVLCLAEGEGRNAVFLAQRGFDVHAVDASEVGLRKARRLAASRGVSITTTVADLAAFDLGESAWDAIVSIWCHVPSVLRASLHARVVRALKPAGALVLEAYTPDQLRYRTGGPGDPDMLMTRAALEQELSGLELVSAKELERDVREGALHHGKGAVVQVFAVRPQPTG